MKNINDLLKVLIICVYVPFKVFLYLAQSTQNNFIEFLNVGQGDAAFIKLQHTKILIDGGPDYDIFLGLQKYMFLRYCHLDLVILTHPHSDHMAGINRILELCSVDHVIYPYFKETTLMDKRFNELIAQRDATIPPQLSSLSIDDARLYFLWPPKGYISTNLNNQSLVILLDRGVFEALFMGDAEIDAQKEIPFQDYSSFILNGLDVLKVAHHGSITGNNTKLYSQYSIRTAIVSVGKNNRYNLPSMNVIDALLSNKTRVCRTDELGSIVMRMDKL